MKRSCIFTIIQLNRSILHDIEHFVSEGKDLWEKLIYPNVDLKGCKLWEPSKDSRVCSKNFIDGEPSNENSYPTRNLGYDATKRTLFLSPSSNKRNSVMTEKNQ